MLDSRQGSGLRWRVEPVRKAGYEGEIEGEEAEVRLSWTAVGLNGVGDEIRQVILGQPITRIRRQKERLVGLVRTE